MPNNIKPAPATSAMVDPATAHVPAATTYSLQWRLILAVLALLALTWMLVIAGTYLHTRQQVSQLLDSHMVQIASLLAVQDVEDIHEENPREDKRPPPPGRFKVPVVYQVWKKGELVAHSSLAPLEPLAPGPGFSGFSIALAAHAKWRIYAMPGIEENVQIVVAENIVARKEIVHASVQTLLASLLLAFPLLAAAIWLTLRNAVKPLNHLSEQIRQRAPQATTPLSIPRMPSEIEPLVHALNQLFARMGDMLHNERRFTADAAHELRTPIAAIRMMAQVAQGAQADAERQQALDGVLQGCDRATRLVEQLLQLARLEADSHTAIVASPSRAVANILPALHQVMHDLQQTLADRRAQTIVWQAPATLPSPMPAPLAGVLLRNLLDNALRYSPDNATVRIVLQALPDAGMRWVVEDSGPGMNEADLARLGERFFRVLGTGKTGSGLGWSIVQRIVLLHGLQIRVDRSDDLGGLRITVSTIQARMQA